MSSEQRQLRRRHLIYYLKVTEQQTDDLIGFLVDITGLGLMLMCEKAYEPGIVLDLKIPLQTRLVQRGHLEFQAQVRWCRESPSGISYDVGFELLNPHSAAFHEIDLLIDELGFRD